MTENNELFDRKHLRLWRISSQAGFLSNIVIIIYIFIATNQTIGYITSNDLYTSQMGNNTFQEPVFILSAFLHIAALLIQGGIYYVTLKGISLGLTMIVETDINYRDEKVRRALNENKHSSKY
jgi:hypothetical protein